MVSGIKLAKTANDDGDYREPNLKKIAETTLQAIERGSIVAANNVSHDLAAKVNFSNHNTRYYAPESLLSTWKKNLPRRVPNAPAKTTEIAILEVSTIDAARIFCNTLSSQSTSYGRIAVLNFASATHPGGGFLNGARAQEESIARASTLYPSLMVKTAQQFYTLHAADRKGGFYFHAMIFSPSIIVFRNDAGDWTEPFEIDVITSAAVNAGQVRKNLSGREDPRDIERKIEKVMRERMARILFLCEQQGAENLVLGSFGTGVFRNGVDVVAKIWADLLTVEGARFKGSFHRIIFAILGTDTFQTFKENFERHANKL
ncbi:hypothetical protein SERLA73DRAFT_190622 [Serpula lacrymans var. lacrymans S7.3]|uniref:Microbial-type PARG catalytic domain-containing protein n=2 Tax=Serpula lacrymans var. lacrymans TaxID=341189 RepID=F8QG21_SERL3|nr:uncharacterized protein SERLADRAFT_463494 [Serpula lacrymans var. lacrymans S7.9]EGN92769.1 hypothetical protein SERLA73DRAFT_190622 [Serpula lacrymans var. lacrymans S7.3]EGO26430.1 hypothetical protein SERLADRAFT_463494 [Serpula lacrymans var. lacrymans S7.9]